AGLVWRRGQRPRGRAQGPVEARVLASGHGRRGRPRPRHLPQAVYRRDACLGGRSARPRGREQAMTAAVTVASFNLGLALPEIVLAAAACVILVADLFVSDARRGISYWLTQLALLAAAALTFALPDDTPQRALGGMFVADKLASVLKIFSYLAVSLTLFYSRTYLAQRGLFRGETFVLMLTALLGMLVMISANNFVPLYLGLELMSLSLYALIALQRESERAIEAAMKYFVLGALASGLLLYGMSMIYGATGTLDIGAAADVMVRGTPNRTIILFGLVFVVSAIAFKLGAVPYHMWVPDVY